MKKLAIAGLIVGLVVGTAICFASETKEKSRRPNKEPAAKATEEVGTPQAYLGVGIEPLYPALASQLPNLVPHGQGVLIAQVSKGSPAEKAGLQKYDIVVGYGSQKIQSPEQLVTLVQKEKPGNQVTLDIIRAGKSEKINAKLGEINVAEMPRRHRVLKPLPSKQPTTPEEAESSWTTFDSMSLTRLDNNRFRAEIKYRDREGKIDSHAFEGTREELRKAIASEKDMPQIERGQLLRALGMRGAGFEFGPAFYRTPGGDVIWDFESPMP